VSRITACRSCGGPDLPKILSLGQMPLANALLTAEQLSQPEPVYPLELAFCPRCSLVQILETVPPEALFRQYLYFSSFSDTMLHHAQATAQGLIRTLGLGPASFVVEIASNDGYLLQHFVKAGVPVLGIEPARNIARVAVERGIPTLAEFFGADLAEDLTTQGQRADLILANNVLAHVADINSVVAGVKRLLKPEGVFVLETPYVKQLIDRLEFDTIYHEHLFYYSLTALERLFRRHGLAVVSVEQIPLHGGSLRVTVVHDGCEAPWDRTAAGPKEGSASCVAALLAAEADWGVGQIGFYRDFADRVSTLRRDLRQFLDELKAKGARLAAYGAAAKGSTLLNFMKIGPQLLDFVVDRSPHKQGRFTPGTHLPIFGTEKLLEQMPAYTLLLTWNFAEEILAQQAEYYRRGGRFILPIPEPRVL